MAIQWNKNCITGMPYIALRVRVVASLEDVLAQGMNRSISVLGQRTLFPLSR